MVKHIQAISWQFADKLFECVWSFCGVGTWRVNSHFNWIRNVKRIADILLITIDFETWLSMTLTDQLWILGLIEIAVGLVFSVWQGRHSCTTFVRRRKLNWRFVREISMHTKRKQLISCSYNNNKILIGKHNCFKWKFRSIHIQVWSPIYFMCGFNVGLEDPSIKNFCNRVW